MTTRTRTPQKLVPEGSPKNQMAHLITTRQQYLHLYSNITNIPRFYGLIKLHKVGHPIRPIVSFSNSPTDNVSKFIGKS